MERQQQAVKDQQALSSAGMFSKNLPQSSKPCSCMFIWPLRGHPVAGLCLAKAAAGCRTSIPGSWGNSSTHDTGYITSIIHWGSCTAWGQWGKSSNPIICDPSLSTNQRAKVSVNRRKHRPPHCISFTQEFNVSTRECLKCSPFINPGNYNFRGCSKDVLKAN